MYPGSTVRCPFCGQAHPKETTTCAMTGRVMPGALAPGQLLDGKYRTVAHSADGGLGALYEADQMSTGARVSIEVAHPELCKIPDALGHYQAEARAAAAIGSAHLPPVTDVGRAPDGSFWIATELLRGQTLAGRLAALGGRMPVGRAAHVARQLAEGLAAAHRQGLVHRDLRPDNVFLVHRGSDPDVVKILDLGWSRVLGEDPAARAAAAAFGVPAPLFLAPEQVRRAPSDHRTDVYAIGALLYLMLTGQPPFVGADANQLAFAIGSGRYAPPRSLNPEIPPPLEQVLQYALALDPAHRYQTAEHLAQTLAPMAQPVSAPPPPAPAPPKLDSTVRPTSSPSLAGGGVAAPRRGGRGLPVLMGAVTAVIVCVGLVVVRGVGGNAEAGAGAGATADAGAPDESPPPRTPAAAAPTEPSPPTTAAATPDAGAATPSPAAPPPLPTPTLPAAPATATVVFAVTPPDVSPEITVDGVPVSGPTAAIPAGPGRKIVARASGYHTFEKIVTVTDGMTIDVELKKRSSPRRRRIDL